MSIKTKFIVLFFTIIISGCKVKYSFTGASIPEGTESFQVNYFQNNSALIEPGIDRDFTLALQDLITNQTNLNLVTSNGDLVFEGEIVEYRISPTTATANNTALRPHLQRRSTSRQSQDTQSASRPVPLKYEYTSMISIFPLELLLIRRSKQELRSIRHERHKV